MSRPDRKKGDRIELHGYVRSHLTGRGIGAARVTLLDAQQRPLASTATELTGVGVGSFEIVLDSRAVGTHTLGVAKTGYLPSTQRIDLPGAGRYDVVLCLV